MYILIIDRESRIFRLIPARIYKYVYEKSKIYVPQRQFQDNFIVYTLITQKTLLQDLNLYFIIGNARTHCSPKHHFNEHEETYNLDVYNILYMHNIHCGYPLTGRRHRNLFSGPYLDPPDPNYRSSYGPVCFMRESNRNLDIPPPPAYPQEFGFLRFGQVKFPTYICNSRSNTPRIVKNLSSNSPPHVRIGSYSIS